MDTAEILKKVRKIEIKTKELSKHLFSGEYNSTFKGRGMSFSEVRNYQYGDDVRNIDWNVTARTGEPHIKVFEEERELTVVFLIDMSSLLFLEQSTNSKVKSILKYVLLSHFQHYKIMIRLERFFSPIRSKNISHPRKAASTS